MTDCAVSPQATIVDFAKVTEKSPNSRKRVPAPLPTPAYILNVTSTVWNISIGQPGCLSGHAPTQLPHTCSLAECEKLEKVLEFIVTTKTISVLSTFFLY